MPIFLPGLSDDRLAALHRQTINELERRVKAATEGLDAAAIIYGNEIAKRALTVAAAGNHSILFLGAPNSGKTMLRAAALELGLVSTFEARPCPCGYWNDPRRDCRCDHDVIVEHLRKLPIMDMTVEVLSPPEREMAAKRAGTGLAEMRQQMEQKSDYTSLELDDHGRNLLKAAVLELELNPDARNRVLAVARTITNLDQSSKILPQHLCEAINYRMRGT